MKKLIITTCAILSIITVHGQSKKYTEVMTKNVATLDTTHNPQTFQQLGNEFERIATAEKKEWLPYYYAAYCSVNSSYYNKPEMVDSYCDKAEAYINKADSLSPNNSEIISLKAQIASARIGVDPAVRGMKFGPQSAELREKAKQLNPANPRPWFLQGTAMYYTPAMFGGGKDKAKTAFEKCIEMCDQFKPESPIHPRWGKASATYFLQMCNEQK